MPKLTLDLSEAQSFEPVEPSAYPMVVDEISDPEKGDKSTFVWVYFAFEDPKLAQHAGRPRRVYPINGKGSGFFREFWKAATGEDLPIGQAIDVDTDLALGRPVLVHLGNREFEGRMQNEVERVAARQ